MYTMSKSQYSASAGLSEKTLRDMVKGNANPKLSVLNEVFNPTGMKIIAQSK